MVLKKTLVLWNDFIFILQVGKKLQEVLKVCALCLITLVKSSCHCLSDSGEHDRTCLIWSNAVNIRSISSCLVLTGLMYTTLFTCLQKKKSRGVRSGDLGGHGTGPPLPIHFSLYTLFSFVLIDGYTVLPQHRIGQGKGIATCFHWTLSINKRIVSTKAEVRTSPTLLDSYKHVNKQTGVHTIALHWCTPEQKIKID